MTTESSAQDGFIALRCLLTTSGKCYLKFPLAK